jgi:hypothetical protein
MSDRDAARLLLAILREDWPAAETLAPGDGTLVATARECDVHPYVHALLERNDRFDLVDGDAAERLGAMRRRCRNDNLLLLARAEQVIDVLQNEGIVPVALKGLDVLHRFYDRFDERAIDDIDLLVRPSEVERSLAALRSAGYEMPAGEERRHWLRSSYEMPITSPGPVGVLVEIHWGLGQEKRYTVDVEAVIDRAVPAEIADRTILRLDDHDAAAHLLLHHLQHYFDRRLKWMLDFFRLTAEPGFEWERLGRRLESWGGRAAAGMSILHLRKLFPERLPSAAIGTLPASGWRRLLTAPLRSSHPLDYFRGTRSRGVQLMLAAAMLERPSELPGYLVHRSVRDRREDASAVERAERTDPAGRDDE